MRPSTVKKRGTPVVQWVKSYHKRTGYDPGTNKLWLECAHACKMSHAGKRHEDTKQLYEWVIERVTEGRQA